MEEEQKELKRRLNKQMKCFRQKEIEWRAEIEVNVHVGLLRVFVGLLTVRVGLLTVHVGLLSVHVGLLSVHMC